MIRTVFYYLFYACVRILHATYRYKVFGEEHRHKAEQVHPKRAFSIGIWHCNAFAGTLSHTYQKFCPLCSHSTDGQMVAFVCSRMGLRPISGSSSRGGKEARQEILKQFDEGYATAITVDGPRGPAGKVKPGIIDIARRGNVAVLPMAAVPESHWTLTSWDKLRIPKPFSRVAVCYNEPIVIPRSTKGDDFDSYVETLDKRLNELEDICQDALRNWS